MGETQAVRGAAPAQRLRISAWVEPIAFMNGEWVETTDADGNKTRTFHPNMANLFNTNALKAEVRSGQPSGHRVIDDLSLLVTIIDNDKPDLKTIWDPLNLQGSGDDVRKDFYQKCIKHCHEVLGVQCLIGFARTHMEGFKKPITNAAGLVIKREPALSTWFKMSTPKPSIAQVTDDIIAFCETNMPDYDGISFDLEGLAGLDSDLPAAKANMAKFYQEIARKLCSSKPLAPLNPAVHDPGYDRLVAFASGNLIGPVGADGKIMRSSRHLKHDGIGGPLSRGADGGFIGTTPPLKAGFAENAQDYSLGTPARNLIIRPMAYDNFLNTDSVDVQKQLLDDWHADIVRYMKGSDLATATFQLGVKTIDGPGQKNRVPAAGETPDALDKKGNKTMMHGMSGVMGGVGASDSDRIKHVRERCRNLLHPNRIGLCFFPTSKAFWKAANEELNPSTPEAGRLIGHPKQCPLSQELIDVLNPPKTPPATP